jgi:hypothetical protein
MRLRILNSGSIELVHDRLGGFGAKIKLFHLPRIFLVRAEVRFMGFVGFSNCVCQARHTLISTDENGI